MKNLERRVNCNTRGWIRRNALLSLAHERAFKTSKTAQANVKGF